MKITIDPGAGFCPGVNRAIKSVEKVLDGEGEYYCMGEIVHNETEIARLESSGLTIVRDRKIPDGKDKVVFFRSHGEPPEMYLKAKAKEVRLIDATCPVVLRLQRKVKNEWERISERNGTLIIFGKKNHPEVVSLNGQTGYKAVVVEDPEEYIAGKYPLPFAVVAQTTADSERYRELVRKIMEDVGVTTMGKESDIINVHDSICRKVSGRNEAIKKLAEENEVVVFVSGKNSSNGKFLYGLCLQTNSKTYLVSSGSEIDPAWFSDVSTVGVTGATSTPLWQLREVSEIIKKLPDVS